MKKNLFILISFLALSIACFSQNVSSSEDYRNIGNAKKLKGDILVYSVFLNSDYGTWNSREKQQYIEKLKESELFLMDKASENNVYLQFYNSYFGLNNDAYIYNNNPYDDIYFSYNIETIYPELKIENLISSSNHNYDGYVLIFYYKNSGRSFTNIATMSSNGFTESIVVYDKSKSSNKNLSQTITHEMLHLFGAHDLYRDLDAVNRYGLYYSIMNTTFYDLKDLEIDELTKYCIGWTNTWKDWYYTFFKH